MPRCTPAAAHGCGRCSTGRRARGFRRKPARSFASWKATITCPGRTSSSAPANLASRASGCSADLVRDLGRADRYYLLHTPIQQNDRSVETIAAGLEASVAHLERSLGVKMDFGRLKEACALSNQARELAIRCNHLRFTSPPLMRGSEAVMFAIDLFSALGQAGVGRVATDVARRVDGGQGVGGTGNRHRRHASARVAAPAAVLQQPAHGFRGVDLPGARDLRGSELRRLAGAEPGRSRIAAWRGNC